MRTIIITGPTACGKTSVSEILATKYGSEIISADSRLVYRELNIGSAKYTISKNIKYHGVDIVNIGDEFNLVDFLDISREVNDRILGRGEIPIVSGGSMLYIERFIKGLDPSPPSERIFRDDMREIARKEGKQSVHNILHEYDPIEASKVHPKNLNSVIRKIEKKRFKAKSVNKGYPPLKDFSCFFLFLEKKKLDDRIESRLKQMMETGWIQEVKGLMDKGYSINDTGFDSIGYGHIIKYLQGRISWKEMYGSILIDTKRYARKQIKWNQRFRCKLINVDCRTAQEVAEEIIESGDQPIQCE